MFSFIIWEENYCNGHTNNFYRIKKLRGGCNFYLSGFLKFKGLLYARFYYIREKDLFDND